MFGLDARIALAIFGALSVISGAALYSAIQEAKVTSYITQLNELGKAWEQYYLDTGTYVPRQDASHAASVNLVKNAASVIGWNGPYVSDSVESGNYIASSNDLSLLRLFLYRKSDYSGVCEAGDCYMWVRHDVYNTNMDLIKAIDLRIDGEVNASTGAVQYFTDGASGSTQTILLYRYAPFEGTV